MNDIATAMASRWPDIAGRIEGRTHVLPIRVYFEDTDAGGVVYHASYLKFAERGRSDFVRLMGVSHLALADPRNGEPAVFVVRHLAIDYRRPSRLDDLLEIVTECVEIGGASLKIRQEVRRADEICAVLDVVCVLMAKTGKPIRISTREREALQRFLNKE